MHHITISTTGIFNAIRPSLFLPIEGKETTTFFNLAWILIQAGLSHFMMRSKTMWLSMVLMLSWNGSGFARSSRPCVRRWASPLRSVAVRSCFPCPSLSATVRITDSLY